MPMPRCELDLYSSTYPGHTLIYPSAYALLSSDNIDKSIGSCDILSTDVFGIGIRPTVGTRQAVPDGRCPKLGHAPRASTFSKQSRHFPKLLFPEAVISRSCQSSSEKILSMISPIANSLCPSDVSAACSEPALSDAETPASLRGSPLPVYAPALPVCILFGCGEHRFYGQRAAQGHGQFLPDV